MYLYNFVLEDRIKHYLINNFGLKTYVVFDKIILRDDFFSKFSFLFLLYINLDCGSIKTFSEVFVGKEISDLVKEEFLKGGILVVWVVQTGDAGCKL